MCASNCAAAGVIGGGAGGVNVSVSSVLVLLLSVVAANCTFSFLLISSLQAVHFKALENLEYVQHNQIQQS